MEEIWKDIIGYEGLYQVSNLGRVKSLSRKIRYINHYNNQEYFRLTKEKIISIGKTRGYNSINLSKNGIHVTCRLCRLVAIHFIENKENKSDVNHIDGNKENDCVLNLEWNTKKENMQHAVKTGLWKPKKGSDNCGSRKVICIKTNKIYDTILDAAIDNNISSSHLSRVLRNIYVNNTTLRHYEM
jgi:hypothetical protein